MEILVCVKSIPSKSIVNENGEICRDKLTNVMNPLDLNALEEANRIREQNGGSVTTISMGVKNTEELLKENFALGADESILLTDKRFAGSDTNATSYILGCAIEKIKNYDLIICGNQSADSSTSQVPVSLAAKLNIPFAINVVETKMINDKRIWCKSLTDFGYMESELNLPALISVVKDINVPRIPTIKNIINSKNKEVIIWDLEDLNADVNKCGLRGSYTKVVRAVPVKRENKVCKFLNVDTNKDLDNIIGIIEKAINNRNDVQITNKDTTIKSNDDIWIYIDENQR